VKLWSKRLVAEVLKATWCSRFMGPTASSIIQIKDETQKSAGDKITYGLRMQLSQAGVSGDSTLEGLEEALTTYSDSVTINQLRGAVRSAGRMTQQRVPFEIREEALSGLRDWWSDRLDTSWLNQICGYTVQTDTRYTGMQATVAPTATTGIILSESASTTENSITTTATFSLSLLDKAVERARTNTPAIRPLMIGGKPMYAVFMHPYQVTDLRTSTSTGQWLDIQKAAMTRRRDPGQPDLRRVARGLQRLHHALRQPDHQRHHQRCGDRQCSPRGVLRRPGGDDGLRARERPGEIHLGRGAVRLRQPVGCFGGVDLRHEEGRLQLLGLRHRGSVVLRRRPLTPGIGEH
jgi:N4-gp56 family major capsid protein